MFLQNPINLIQSVYLISFLLFTKNSKNLIFYLSGKLRYSYLFCNSFLLCFYYYFIYKFFFRLFAACSLMSFDFAFHFFLFLLLSWLCCSCVYHAYKKEVIKRNETKEQKKNAKMMASTYRKVRRRHLRMRKQKNELEFCVMRGFVAHLVLGRFQFLML